MDEQIVELEFPTFGVDMSLGLTEQRPQTCAVGTNVRLFEPSELRSRGGARNGTIKYVPALVNGVAKIQHLNLLVYADYAGLGLTEPPGNPPTVDDPSSPGAPGSWGTGTLYNDPNTGDPVTGQNLGTRVPGGGSPYGPAKRRMGGTGFQPNKNVLTGTAPPPLPGACFQGVIGIVVTKPAPDPLNWTGQQPSFIGASCVPATAQISVGGGLVTTTTALVIGRAISDMDGPIGMPLATYIKIWLYNHVGSDAYGTVNLDQISPPIAPSCTLGHACSASPPSVPPRTPSNGTVLHASATG